MRERSIFKALVIPLLALLAVETLVFVVMLRISGVFSRLDNSDRELFDKQVQNRATYLESSMEDVVRTLGNLSEQIRYAGYNSNTQAMITMYLNDAREATGADEVFLLTDEDAGALSGKDYYRIPYEAARNREMRSATNAEEAYAYWGTDSHVTEEGEHDDIVCTVPLIAGYGAPYGIVGVRFTPEDLRTMLPYDELLFGEDASYMLCLSTEGGLTLSGEQDLREAAYSGLHEELFPVNNTLLLRASDGGGFSHTVNGEVYYVSAQSLNPYVEEDSPVQTERWFLAGVVKSGAMYHYSTQIVRTITLTMLLMLLTGIAGSLLISRRLSNPIRRLSDEVTAAQREQLEIPHLSVTGISEIDQFAGAITSMSRDMIYQRSLEMKRIEHERDYDLLTGLLTRTAFQRECARIFATPDLLGCAAMLMIDLDNVKEINDNFGHDLGDAYIRMAAYVFKEATPDNTLLAKVAGDEFYILFYGYDDRRSLEETIDRLREAIADARLSLPEGQDSDLMVTGGVAWYPEDGATHAELMRLAEFATYQLKSTGKGQIVNFDRGEYLRSASAVKQHKEFERLLDNYDLATFHFQPIFKASDGHVHAYESLLRVNLQHLKMPSEVLELARHAGRMMDIEKMTWTRSLQCYETLLKMGLVETDAKLFINSISSLALPERDMRRLSMEHAALMPRVVIEITESEFMNEEATARKRDIPGFSGLFALDDYGSGYNSERTLLELTPKYIKVDLSIIRDIDSSQDKQRIVSNIVRYAHEREMLIIAEGIETAGELDTVCNLGVDLLQGHFLAVAAATPPALSAEASHRLDLQEHAQGDAS